MSICSTHHYNESNNSSFNENTCNTPAIPNYLKSQKCNHKDTLPFGKALSIVDLQKALCSLTSCRCDNPEKVLQIKELQQALQQLREQNVIYQLFQPELKKHNELRLLRHKIIKYFSRVFLKDPNQHGAISKTQERDLLIITPFLCTFIQRLLMKRPKEFCTLMKNSRYFILKDLLSVIEDSVDAMNTLEIAIIHCSPHDMWYNSYVIRHLCEEIRMVSFSSNTMNLVRALVEELPDNSLFIQLQDSMICFDFVGGLLEYMTEPTHFLKFCPMLISLLHFRGDYCQDRIKAVSLVSKYMAQFIIWLDPEFSSDSVRVVSLQWMVLKLIRILVLANEFSRDLTFHIKILFDYMISKPRSDMVHSYITQIICHVLDETPFAKSIEFRGFVIEFLVEQLLPEPFSKNSVEKPYLAHLRVVLDVMFNEYHELVQMKSFVSSELWEKLHFTETVHFPTNCE